MQRLLKHLRTSDVCAQEKKEWAGRIGFYTSKVPNSTELSQALWLKVVTLLKAMGLEVSPFTERNFRMRTLSSSTMALVYSQWLTLARELTDLNSSCASMQLAG